MSLAIGTLVDVKKMFFDRAAVVNATDKATRKALNYAGGFVKKAAKNSIKKSKSVSTPGATPSSHVGLLKGMIFSAYDASHRSAVVGPVLINRPTSKDALEMLEYGGQTKRKGKPAQYRARPFMGPAMEKSAPFDRFWEDSVK